MKYPKLFEPITISNVTIKNRIALAPMGLVGLTTPEGNPTQRAMNYYLERAKGGVGLIITGLFKVENEIDACALDIARITPASRWILSEFCDSIHALDTKIFIQLTAGFGRVIRPTRFSKQPVSASPNPNYWDPSITCRELTTGEVESIAEAFGNAAEIVADIGFDGIELHGHEGYLLDQFTTAIWNQRTDKYGGDLKGRMTFPIEILGHIKKRVGKKFPVQYRFGIKHYIKGLNQGALPKEDFKEAGRDVEEGIEMTKMLEEAGFDALHVDAGCYDSWYWAHPPSYQEHGCMVDMAVMAKRNVSIPITAVGRLEIPELAEKVISNGQADMVALGRALLADAYWPQKVRNGQIKHIRPCVGCHGCFARFDKGRPLSCVVNPICGRERIYPILPAKTPKKVLIIGGGIAGMEAACVAAQRGHIVTLCEKSDKLGGHILSASVPGFKKDLRRLQSYYEIQLETLAVKILFGREATIDWVTSQNPDVLIVAVGSSVHIPDIPGVNNKNVCTCTDVLLNKCQVGKNPLIVGGSLEEDGKTPSSFEYNVAVTRKVVDYAHERGVSVEGEIGTLGGIEDGHGAGGSGLENLTDPDQAVEFVEKTGVDALAVAIGTSHGAYKFSVKPTEDVLKMSLIEEINKRLPETHLVMHGSSSVPQELREIINKYGGNLKPAWGVPVEEIQKGIAHGVRKVNVDTDNRLAITGGIRKVFVESPEAFDPRKYLGPARAAMQKVVEARMTAFGQKGHAGDYEAKSLEEMISYYK